MHTTPGARGIVIGDRYRVAGALRRTGLIDAIDLEADQRDAACRIVGVPGDPERVDAWEDAWRTAQGPARLPRLREIVPDADGAHWAILDAARTGDGPLPHDARVQARRLGEALAAAGLDAADVKPEMLVVDGDGALAVDGPVWLGGGLSPRAAGLALADLLPREVVEEPDGASPSRPRRTRRTGRRPRLLVSLAIALALVTAAAVLLLPSRSSGVAVVAPGPSGSGDALLVSAQQPLLEPIAPADPPPRRRRPPRAVRAVAPTAAPSTAEAAVAAPLTAPGPPVAVDLPPAVEAPDLPIAELPELPVDGGGW